MTPSPPPQDLATQWKLACRLYPVYFEIAREFVIDVEPCPALAEAGEIPGDEEAKQAIQWVAELDQRIQAHQFRQFLQTSSMVAHEGLVDLMQYFLAQTSKNDAVRDKVDFLLVQYFSQAAPSQLDNEVDLDYVARALDQVLGQVDLKTPVWLNALDRVLDSARRCRSLDELLHSGVLEQGRKAKAQAGDLFFLPIALVAFTRYGYLMRRVFFRLMHGDLNVILDGLDELDENGVETIDCRRAQFSEQEPVSRLRMICQSWKVLFQAEYSSGQPLRMLVDLRASVEHALGRGSAAAQVDGPGSANPVPSKSPGEARAAAAGAGSGNTSNEFGSTTDTKDPRPKPVPMDAPEFEVTASPEWDADDTPPPKKKK
ncbi:MAG TPA: hypothetical protein VIH89_03190 [Candidatus Sulfotelmatobacter sp.]